MTFKCVLSVMLSRCIDRPIYNNIIHSRESYHAGQTGYSSDSSDIICLVFLKLVLAKTVLLCYIYLIYFIVLAALFMLCLRKI